MCGVCYWGDSREASRVLQRRWETNLRKEPGYWIQWRLVSLENKSEWRLQKGKYSNGSCQGSWKRVMPARSYYTGWRAWSWEKSFDQEEKSEVSNSGERSRRKVHSQWGNLRKFNSWISNSKLLLLDGQLEMSIFYFIPFLTKGSPLHTHVHMAVGWHTWNWLQGSCFLMFCFTPRRVQHVLEGEVRICYAARVLPSQCHFPICLAQQCYRLSWSVCAVISQLILLTLATPSLCPALLSSVDHVVTTCSFCKLGSHLIMMLFSRQQVMKIF